MSSIIATVTQIERCDALHVLRFSTHGESLSMMSLDISEAIMIGTKVKLSVKPSHIALAKDLKGEVSYANQIPCKIRAVENGKLLSSIKLDFFDTTLESVITLSSSQKMHLSVGDDVLALIKASELSIKGIVDV